MRASFNQFRNHIWGPFDHFFETGVKHLLTRTMHSQIAAIFNYYKLETCAPIELCAFRVIKVYGLEFKVCKGQPFLNLLYEPKFLAIYSEPHVIRKLG